MAADPIDLCTVEDVRAELKLAVDDNDLDALIQTHITNASDTICGEYEREFKTTLVGPGTTTVNGIGTRRFAWERGQIIDLCPWDLQEATLVSLHPESDDPLTLDPDTPDYELTPIQSSWGTYTSLRLSLFLTARWSPTRMRFGHCLLDVTGTWGFPSVPLRVKQAGIETAAFWVRRDIGHLAQIDIMEANYNPSRFAAYSIPPGALRKLAPFRRSPGIVAA